MKNQNLYYKVFEPQGEVKAAVFVVHGMQEHHARYDSFAKTLADNGIGVITYDLPGHGQRALEQNELGWFGEEDGWQNLVASALQIAELTRKQFPNVPIYYFGHSMGTMIARTFLQKYDSAIDGMILSGAPNYNPAGKAGELLANVIIAAKGKKDHSNVLTQLATGGFNKQIQNPKTPVDWLSYNEENVQRYIDDPLCGQPFTNQGYKDLFILMQQMHKKSAFHCTKSYLPIYFYGGEDDPCMGGIKGFNDTVTFLQSVGYQKITSKQYPNCRHESLQESCSEVIIADIISFVEKNTQNI